MIITKQKQIGLWLFFIKLNMIRVTCAIITEEGKILICRRGSQMNNAGKWEFPGGKVKPDETEEACIKREIFEELNIKIHPEKQIRSFMSGSELELIPFICKEFEGEITLVEHSEYTFCKPGEFHHFDFTQADVQLYEHLLKIPELLG